MRIIVLALLSAFVSACGFHLRGQTTLPFDTLYVPGGGGIGLELRRNLTRGSSTRLVDAPKEAQASLGITMETREKVILSLDASGVVREYRLRYRVGFRVSDAQGRNFVSVPEIELTRDISFNSQVLAKESEEALLWRDMQSDMVQQILRRLAAARAPAADEQ